MKRSNLDLWVRKTEGLPVLDRAAVEALQLAGLNALLERERARGGFYSGLPGGLASLSDLASLPFTTQADLAARGSGMVLVSQSEILRVLTETSGTTGPAKRVFYTPGDCENTVSFFAAGLSELVFPGSRTMVCMPFSGPYGLGELISAAIESLGASPIKTGVEKSYGELSDTRSSDLAGYLCGDAGAPSGYAEGLRARHAAAGAGQRRRLFAQCGAGGGGPAGDAAFSPLWFKRNGVWRRGDLPRP